ncbi:MAG: hypothetical protein CL582_21855 [Alteromonadaceae bacterium]|nr:hypothetical protein [Alteromonadaceae bacterium]
MFGNESGFTLEPITFTKAKTVIPGVRTEYLRITSGVKFHFWADPEFPETFGEDIKEAFDAFPKEDMIVEYVPEVESWYGELRNLNILSDQLIEMLVKKISTVVMRNGER